MSEKKSPSDLLIEQSLETICDAVIAHVSEAQRNAEDPFEEYAFGIQAKVFFDSFAFKERCLLGYRALLKVMPSLELEDG